MIIMLLVCSFLLALANAQSSITGCPSAETSVSETNGKIYAICPGSDFQLPSTLILSNVANTSSCLSTCSTTSGCQRAVYDRQYSVCHLKGTASQSNWVSTSRYDTIRVTGQLTVGAPVTTCPVTQVTQVLPDGHTSIVCSGTDFATPSLEILSSVPNSSACAQLCGTRDGCTNAVYDRVYRVCHLKGQISSSTWNQNPQYEAIWITNSTQGSNPTRKTPIMGYNSYNDVGCSPNSDLMTSAMNAMSSKGFLAMGYSYFQIDCGWQGFNRLSNGSITYDSTRFPNGIKPLSDYAIGLGFKWSMYTDQGVYSCDTQYDPHRPGSLGYETQDAAMFAAWNVQYMKVDNCFVDPNDNAPKNALSDFPQRYGAMWNALEAVGIRNMLICQWGVPYQNKSTNSLQGPTAWAPAVSTSFRISDDIAQGWSQMTRIYNQVIHACLLDLVGPGHFADMDLLEVGNPGMTVDEQKTHFAIWATFKSALMISTNIPQMSAQTASIVGNLDLIAVNQDALGRPVKLVQRFSNNYDIFLGPLANGDQVILVVDQSNSPRSITVNFNDIGIRVANVKDLWTGQQTKGISSITANLAAHGSCVWRLSQIQAASMPVVQYNIFAAATASLNNGAYVSSCSTCTSGQKVAGVVAGSGASITFDGIRTSQATSDILIDYINCDVQYLGSSIPNVRAANISVNGGKAVTVLFPLSGYNWGQDRLTNFKVRLGGFDTSGPNRIIISAANQQGDAPDFDRIQVRI